MAPRTGAVGRHAAAIVVLAVVAATAAGVSLATGGRSVSAQAAPACARAHPVVARPEAVPAGVLPAKTQIRSVQRMRPGITVVRGVVQADLRHAVDFFVHRLPASGYRLFDGDAEVVEAESRFGGHGLTGKWRVNAIPGCPGAVRLGLFVQR